MWNSLTPQQQKYLMAMLMGGHAALGQPATALPAGMPGGGQNAQAQQLMSAFNPQLAQPSAQAQQLMGAFNPQLAQQSGSAALGNPLMTGGNSAVSPQQQAAMMQYQQMLQSPQGWGATANGNVPMWQLMMGRSPAYGTGGAVP